MSLRLRLLIGIVALAAAGLVTLDFVSYRALENHLSERVDDQARNAARALGPLLRERAGIEDASPFRGNRGPSPSRGFPGDPGSSGFPNELPPGTYAELRSSSGLKLASISFDYGTSSPQVPVPDLSDDIPVSQFDEPGPVITVSAIGQTDERFRVDAVADPLGRVTIAAVPMSDMQETLDQLLLIEAVVTAAVLIALAGLAWWMIGIGLRPLKRMSETAGEIAGGDLSRRVDDVSPKTETGRLGLSLNAMLGQIEESIQRREASETRMRQFLADASHELRTPLASIRGYAELYRLGAITDGPEVDRAMTRIEKESARMGDLVDGLLALARLDELPEPVRRPVDLSVLAGECRDDALAIAPDREITMESAEDVTLLGDEGQIRQLLTNLLRNAIEHTPDGTPVEITLATGTRTVELEVRDHGPGINEDHAEQLFERFWREGESRSRSTGGAGIGLAVVAAVAAAHGGSAEARNATDGGAIFRVILSRDPDSGAPPDSLHG